jgi:hypothetical protein
MFVAAGEPGTARKVAASVAAARKVFRVGRPLEVLTPVIMQPGLAGPRPKQLQLLDKARVGAVRQTDSAPSPGTVAQLDGQLLLFLIKKLDGTGGGLRCAKLRNQSLQGVVCVHLVDLPHRQQLWTGHCSCVKT